MPHVSRATSSTVESPSETTSGGLQPAVAGPDLRPFDRRSVHRGDYHLGRGRGEGAHGAGTATEAATLAECVPAAARVTELEGARRGRWAARAHPDALTGHNQPSRPQRIIWHRLQPVWHRPLRAV